MKYWIITDTHFGHNAMTDLCKRPKNFEIIILENLAKTTKENINDVIIHLGDVCWGKDAHWHWLFMCATSGIKKKWLIRGNHDKKTNSWYLRNGWDFISDRIDLTLFGKHIVLTHKPIDDYIPLSCVNIHGHQHNTTHHKDIIAKSQHICIFIEKGCKYGNAYSPINLRSIVENKK